MRLLLDEHISPALVSRLAEVGVYASPTPISAFSNKLGVEMGTGPQGPFLGLRIEFDQAKAQMPAFIPLKVVGETPMKIASQIQAILEHFRDVVER
jgi:hypothetical protein